MPRGARGQYQRKAPKKPRLSPYARIVLMARQGKGVRLTPAEVEHLAGTASIWGIGTQELVMIARMKRRP